MVIRRKGKITRGKQTSGAQAKYPAKMYSIKITHALGPFPSIQACGIVEKRIKAKVKHAKFTRPVKGRGGYKFNSITHYHQKVAAPASMIKKYLEAEGDVKATVTLA